jgi:hypothetical protein
MTQLQTRLLNNNRMTMNEYVTKPGAPVALSSFTLVYSGIPQRQCACRQKREATTLQWAASHAAVNPAAPPTVYEVLHSSGQPPDTATRVVVEPWFGNDLTMRVRTDAHAGYGGPRS